MTHPKPSAVLWDMDGTLVNTEPYWMAAEIELVESYGGSWTHEQAEQLVGQGLEYSAAILQGRGVTLGIDEIISLLTDRVLHQLAEFGTPWRPGALELLTKLREAGVPTALVTMSTDRMAQSIIDQIGFPAFDAKVTFDDVTLSKPHPEAYLRGAELLGVDITTCVAIEDSVPGIGSAVAAGAVVIGVPFIVPLDEGGADVLWPTLEGRTLDDLSALLATVATR